MPSFVKRRASEISSACFALFGFVLLASLTTYNAADPSLNHLSDAAPTNILGFFGATLIERRFRDEP